MRAVLKKKPGPGIEIEEVDDPSPKRDQILVEVKAASICGSDLHIYEWIGGYEWLPLPIIMSHEFSGKVVEYGKDIVGLRVNDRVVCMPMYLAEHVCLACKAGQTYVETLRYWAFT